MLNVECLMLNEAGGRRRRHNPFNIQHSTFNIPVLLLLLALPATANELTVDKRSITLTDSLTITLTLTDSFAQLDSVRLNVQNLVVDGEPSTSTEFQWINGQTFRRKVFRWAAHAKEPGAALVGPVALHAPDGQVDTLAPLSIQVLPDATAGSNDPAKIMRELIVTGRAPVFIVADADRERVLDRKRPRLTSRPGS